MTSPNNKNASIESSDLELGLQSEIKKFLGIGIGLGVVGWANAFYALWHRQNIFANGLAEKSFCNVNQAIDCDSVAFSKFSSILGFPTAAWGMIFYAICMVFMLSAYFSAHDRKRGTLFPTLRLLFFFNVLNIVPTIALAGISLFRLGTLCLICLGTYLINLAMIYFSYRAHALAVNHEDSGRIDVSLKHAFSNLIIGCSALLLALHLVAPKVVSQMVGARALDDSTINQVVANFVEQPSIPFDIQRSPSFGPDNAPIVVVEFSDFQCPHCAMSSKTMPSFLKAYAGQVKYVYKFYPLDSSCNPEIKSSFHALACRAAKTSYCVFKEKGAEAFFSYKSKVFEDQETMSPESILSMAKEEGLEESAIKACVDDPATHQFVLDNVAEGSAGKVTGTPAIFVNGRMVATGPVPQVLTRVFDLVLDSMKR